jgi:transposase
MKMDAPYPCTIVNTREGGYTLFGAISNKSERLFFKIFKHGNAENFEEFLLYLLEVYPQARDAIIVGDYAGAHTKKNVTDFLDTQGMVMKFQPSNSCIVNPIEHVWGTIKQQWTKLLVK